jgi:hypothetical protein
LAGFFVSALNLFKPHKMRQSISLVGLIIFAILTLAHCKKGALTVSKVNNSDSLAIIASSNNDTISPYATPVGVWHIIKDSFFVVQAAPFLKYKDSVYSGKATDYYDFKPDGSLYIKEGSTMDTLAYQILANNQLAFIYNYYNIVTDSLGNIISKTKRKKTYRITALTATNLTMSSNISSDILTPVGYFANRLKLIK